jgi:hypothetical protein
MLQLLQGEIKIIKNKLNDKPTDILKSGLPVDNFNPTEESSCESTNAPIQKITSSDDIHNFRKGEGHVDSKKASLSELNEECEKMSAYTIQVVINIITSLTP